jgi:hypothetical protein
MIRSAFPSAFGRRKRLVETCSIARATPAVRRINHRSTTGKFDGQQLIMIALAGGLSVGLGWWVIATLRQLAPVSIPVVITAIVSIVIIYGLLSVFGQSWGDRRGRGSLYDYNGGGDCDSGDSGGD